MIVGAPRAASHQARALGDRQRRCRSRRSVVINGPDYGSARGRAVGQKGEAAALRLKVSAGIKAK